MVESDTIDKIAELVRQAEERAYARGLSDGVEKAKAQILAAVSVPAQPLPGLQSRATHEVHATEEAAQRKRAPKGLPRKLVTRVLSGNPTGVTPQDIADAAETEFERMIAVSSIRSELRKGQEIDRYLEVDGLWHLADGIEAEGNGLAGQPPASDVSNANGGKSNAAALD